MSAPGADHLHNIAIFTASSQHRHLHSIFTASSQHRHLHSIISTQHPFLGFSSLLFFLELRSATIVSVGISDEQRSHVVIIYWYTLRCVLSTGAQTSVSQLGKFLFSYPVSVMGTHYKLSTSVSNIRTTRAARIPCVAM